MHDEGRYSPSFHQLCRRDPAATVAGAAGNIAHSLLGEQQRLSISSVNSSGVLSQPETVVVPMSENVAVHDIDRSVSNHAQNVGTLVNKLSEND